jgi:hypothetical protein
MALLIFLNGTPHFPGIVKRLIYLPWARHPRPGQTLASIFAKPHAAQRRSAPPALSFLSRQNSRALTHSRAVELSFPSHRPRSKHNRSPHERRSQHLDLAGHWPRTVGPMLHSTKLRYCNRRKPNVSSRQGQTRPSKDALVTSERPALPNSDLPSLGRRRRFLSSSR